MTDASNATANESQQKYLTSSVKKLLAELDYNYTVNSSDENILRLIFKGEKYEYPVIIFCGEKFLTIQCAMPLIISEDKFPEILKHVNALNLKIPLGNYELHPDSNKFIYKIGSSIPPMLNKDELENIISLSISFTDLSANKVLEIIS